MDFKDIMKVYSDEIFNIKSRVSPLHKSNIRASGNEVEEVLRRIIREILPEKYLVSQGHIINKKGEVSNQIDIIISDRQATPKLFLTQDKTSYLPIETVLAIGEIKSTINKHHVIEFQNTIKQIRIDMERPLILNTCFGGLNDESNLYDAMNFGMNKRVKNPLLSFLFGIDGCKYKTLEYYEGNIDNYPNMIVNLSKYFIITGKINEDKNFEYLNSDEHGKDKFNSIICVKCDKEKCLTQFICWLNSRLNMSEVEPVNLFDYLNADFRHFLGKDIKVFNILPKK